MITIREGGNTTIRITTGGVAMAGGEQWTVYPYVDNDPTLQKFDADKQRRIKELSITGLREKGDYSGKGMQKDMGVAVAQLEGNLNENTYNKDLGLIVGEIDIEPDSEMAHFLESQYGIKAIKQESQISSETKG